MTLDTLLDILKVTVGLVYLYLEYNAKRGLWIASVIMPAIGIWLFFNKGLYADCLINVYYLVIAAYGWYVWSFKKTTSGREETTDAGRKGKSADAVRISHIPARQALALAGLWLAIWGLIAMLLRTFTDSNVVLLDSFTTSLSIVGMWMLARKYIEQWLIWFVVDAVYVYLYWYKGIYFSGSLYAFYTVMAILGYRKWLLMARSDQSDQSPS